MNRFMVRTIIFLFVLIPWGCGGADKKNTLDSDPPIPVEVITVGQGDIEDVREFFGNVIADQAVKVYSTVPNRIVAIYVEIGDRVQAGDVLAQIDTEKITQAVIQAEAGLEAVQAQFKTADAEWMRIQRLLQDNAVSQSQYESVKAQRDAARSNVKQMKATLSTANSQLRDTKITTPLDGVIANRLLNVGDLAAPQIPLFEVVKMDPVRVLIDVIERHLDLIKPGQKARIFVSSYPDAIFEGTVTRVNPTLNPLTRTASAEIKIRNRALKLKPGMFARVEVITAKHKNIALIPKHTILEKTMLSYENGRLSTANVNVEKHVFVFSQEIAEKRSIKTGIEQGNQIEIVEGVAPGDTVISIGQHNLSDSARVEIITSEY